MLTDDDAYEEHREATRSLPSFDHRRWGDVGPDWPAAPLRLARDLPARAVPFPPWMLDLLDELF